VCGEVRNAPPLRESEGAHRRRGYQPSEYRGYGIDQTKSRELFDESIEIILPASRLPRATARPRFAKSRTT
jgi:hypothetical protein